MPSEPKMRRSICTGRPFGKVAEPDSDPLAPFAKTDSGRVVVVDAGRRFAGDREHLARRQIGDAEEEPERVDELAPAEPAGALRVGPGRGRRAEHRALGLLHRLAGEEVLERVRHLQDDVLDPADAGGEAAGLFHPWPEIPAIGDDDLAPRLLRRAQPAPGRRRRSWSAASRRGRGSPSPTLPRHARNGGRAARRRRRRPSAPSPASRDSPRSRGRCRRSSAPRRARPCPAGSPRRSRNRRSALSTGMWLTTAHQPAPMTPIRALPFIRSLPSPRRRNDARSAGGFPSRDWWRRCRNLFRPPVALYTLR